MKDSLGGKGSARVHVTTTRGRIRRSGSSSPTRRRSPRGVSTLSWNVQNATTVSISGIGNVPPQRCHGFADHDDHLSFDRDATRPNRRTATATVVVSRSTTQVMYCYASPTNIIAGESATLFYQTKTRPRWYHSGYRQRGCERSFAVMPTATTNYTLTATGANGTTDYLQRRR